MGADDESQSEVQPEVGLEGGATPGAVVACGRVVGDVVPVLWAAEHEGLVLRAMRAGLDQEDADDVVQLAFARIVEEWSTFDGGSLGGWLNRLFHFEVLTRLGERRVRGGRDVNVEQLAEVADAHHACDGHDCAELIAALEQSREGLDELSRLVFDTLGDNVCEAILLNDIFTKTGVELSSIQFRKRRQRLRRRAEKYLAVRGIL